VTVLFHSHGAGCELDLIHETTPELALQVRRDWIKVLNRLAVPLDESSRDSRPRVAVRRGNEPIFANVIVRNGGRRAVA